MKNEKKKIAVPRLVIMAAIAAAVVAADQITKFYVAAYLREIGSLPLIENVFHFTYVENTGAAFGMLSDKRWVFMVFSSLALVGIAVFAVINRRGNMFTNVSLALIFGGGIGNMIDRIALGYVIDFIDVRAIKFYVFNVADSCVTVGCFMLVFALILGEARSRKKKNAPAQAEEKDE